MFKLIISMIGYKNILKEITVTESLNNLNFVLINTSFETSEVVVSANKRVQAVQDVPISICVFDDKYTKDRNFNRIDDVLRIVPGVNLNKDNVNIRGSSGFAFGVGSRILLLMDGFPMLSGDNGDMKFDAIPMINVDRVEVVKGAGSALYGSSALGGVINILTKEPKDNFNLSAKTFVGLYTQPRFESWKYTDNNRLFKGFEFSTNKKFGDFGAILSAGIFGDDSYRQFDDSKRYYIFSKVNYEISQNVNFKLLANLSQENRADWIYWRSLDSVLVPPASTDQTSRMNTGKININGDLNIIFDSKNFLSIKSGMFLTKFTAITESSDWIFTEESLLLML